MQWVTLLASVLISREHSTAPKPKHMTIPILLSPLLHFLCYAMRSLINCKAWQTAAMVDETFLKYIDGGSLLVQRHYR